MWRQQIREQRAEGDARVGRRKAPSAGETAARAGLSPEEILGIRKKADLSQKQLADTLRVSAN